MLGRALIALALVVGSSSTSPDTQQPSDRVSADRLVARARALIVHESGEPLSYLLQALRIRSARGDLAGVDEVLRLLAEHARDAGDAYQWGESIVELDRHRRVSDAVLGRDLAQLGRQYRYARRFADAAECLDKAERIAHREADLGLLAGILVQRANLAADEGRFLDAGMYQASANEVFERLGLPVREHAEVLAELGQLQAESGLLLDAWRSFDRAGHIASLCLPRCERFWEWKKVNDSALLSSIGRARLFAAFGRFEDAVREGQNARRLALRSNLGDRRYMILAEMAEWVSRVGRPDLAERWYELALRVGDPYARMQVRIAYASYMIEQGRGSEALSLLGEVPTDGPPKQRVERLLLMGRASLARKDKRGAISLFRQAVRAAHETVPLPALLWQAHSGLGEALVREDRIREGTNELQAAVQVVRDWAGGVLDPALAYEDGPKSPWHGYSRLVATYVRQGRAELALALSEEMKQLVSLADRSDRGLTSAVVGQSAERVAEIRMAIANARRALHENKLHDPTARARVTAELQLLDNELMRLTANQGRLRTYSDRSEALLTAARKLASDRACAIVSYCLTRDECVALVITATGLEAKRLAVSRDQLRSLAGLMRIYKTSPEVACDSDPAPTLLQSLHSTLIEPLRPQLRSARRIVIVPDGVLWTLPFEMLWRRQGRKVEYLIQRYAISYAPSVRDAVEWSARSDRRRLAGVNTVRVIANGVPKNESSRELSPRQVSVAINDADIVRNALGSRVSVARGAAATKDAMIRALVEADVVHVAAHGTYADDYPPASYISLAQANRAETSGLLRGWELANAKCQARLVFLAACDTGRTASVRGRGLLGLIGSLMAAGAHASIGSRWADRDAATERYLARFYQHYATSLDASDAARKAACDLIAEGAPPYDWAAFMVLGW